MSIVGNMVGGTAPIKTIMLQDENGVELTGVVVENLTVFTADPKLDIREGKVAATSEGVVTGSKVIPSFHTSHGTKLVPVGRELAIRLDHLDKYDYTVLHCIICTFNTGLTDSTAAERVAMLDSVFDVKSSTPIATLSKDDESKSIIFNLTNTGDTPLVLRYITYKEIN